MSRFSAGISPAALKRAGIETKPGDFASDLEGEVVAALHHAGLPDPEREVCLISGRQWRCDFVYRDARLVIEAEGGTFSGGRHTRGKGFEDDCRKYAALTLAGWKVLRVTGAHVTSGELVQWVREALHGPAETTHSILTARSDRYAGRKP